MKIQLKLKKDRNGNKVLNIKVNENRAFNIQTNGNLEGTHNFTHENFNRRNAIDEALEYICKYGSKKQKTLLEVDKPFDIYNFCHNSYRQWETDRKRTKLDFAEIDLKDYDIDYIIDHIEYLMSGDLGYHGRIIAQNTMKTTKSANKNAMLTNSVLDFLGVPVYYQKKWFKSLSESDKENLNNRISESIAEFVDSCNEILIYRVLEKAILV